jgi:cysteinyl-tRNA synthetase
VVTEGNKQLTAGNRTAIRGSLASVLAMLGVLGLDPPTRLGSPAVGRRELSRAVDALVAGLLEERAEARADKDFAAADAIRDRISAAGIAVEDTPTARSGRWRG